MKRPIVLLVGIGCVAASANAAILPVTATFTTGLATLPPVIVTGSGVGSSVGGGAATVPAGLFDGNAQFYVPVPTGTLWPWALSVPADSVGNPGATFSPNGAMGLSGAYFFLGPGSPQSMVLAPFGGGGTAMVVLNGIPVTLLGATWMGGDHVFTFMGAALANAVSASATAYDNRTAAGRGTLQLVAPASVRVSGGSLGHVPHFATLTLTYTPEPGTLLLLAVGMAGLARRGRALRP